MALLPSQRPRTHAQVRARLTRFMAESLNRLVLADQTVPRTFRAHARIFRARDGKGALHYQLPHYWATAYHEGRGPVRARPGKWLVFWKNPDNDPRLSGGRPPIRAKDRRRLTRDEWQRAIKDPQVVITKEVAPWRGNPFVRRAAAKLQDGFWLRATEKKAADLIEGYLDQKLGFRGVLPGKQTKKFPAARARIRLR